MKAYDAPVRGAALIEQLAITRAPILRPDARQALLIAGSA
jgi:hypothetical protein